MFPLIMDDGGAGKNILLAIWLPDRGKEGSLSYKKRHEWSALLLGCFALRGF